MLDSQQIQDDPHVAKSMFDVEFLSPPYSPALLALSLWPIMTRSVLPVSCERMLGCG